MAYPLSVWAKPSIWHSARQNLRRAMRSFRNVSRTGLCSDSFRSGCSTTLSQSKWDSKSRSQPLTAGSHISRQGELNECQTTFVITLPVMNTNNKDKIYEFNQHQPNRTPS